MNLLGFILPGPDFAIDALLGIPIGLLSLYRGFTSWKTHRKLVDIPTSKVRSTAVGLVELNGKAKPIKLLTSPLTKKPCMYYCIEHQVYKRGAVMWNYETTDKVEKYTNFYIEDDTGKIEVNPKNAGFKIAFDYIKSKEGSIERDVEYKIEPGENVYVLGTARIKPGAKSVKNEKSLIIAKGENDPFYYIADSSVKETEENAMRITMLLMAFGFVLLLFSFGYLFYRAVA